MPANGPRGAPPPDLDIVTVVYRRELPLLRLQACSVAQFLDPAGISRIIVIVNDVAEAECIAAVEALRPAYGALAARLDVIGADALFALRPPEAGPHGIRQALRLWFAQHRRIYPFGVKRGWRGNRGWSVQQALKLAVARRGEGRMLLILDAKNHFVAPVRAGTFLAADGRARSTMKVPGEKHWTWIRGAFALLGASPPQREAPAPVTVTPVVVPRDMLLGTLEAVEQRVGPVEGFFARAKGDLSEFMLIYAHVTQARGAWPALFQPDLPPAATIFRRSPPEQIEAALHRVETGEAEILSVHSSQMDRLDEGVQARLCAIWRARGLPDDLFRQGD
ncbi:DUF6492 family protein [Rhodobacteraceae bacterium DSL-40]|uniref:DUF6492 family protein n=1 Tax=Amaricoccus sp. B4 TaxID=3368557 RepID=UPI000DAC34AB